MSDQHSRRGAGHGSNRVMLGHPETSVAQSLSRDRELGRFAKRLGGRRTGCDRRQVENGEGDHGWIHLKGGTALNDNRSPLDAVSAA
jgi:hypothetical protein